VIDVIDLDHRSTVVEVQNSYLYRQVSLVLLGANMAKFCVLA
jgi:hypothetical protein